MIEPALPYHIPALAKETIDLLAIQPDGTYVDATFGGGGHARLIISNLSAKGQLYAFDQDADAYQNRINDPRFHFIHGNFRYLKQFLHYYGVTAINGIIADLGVSFHHFDTPERGFSFRLEGPLDMRMNRQAKTTAADILNTYTEEQLANIFRLYGELPSAMSLARAILQRRQQQPFTCTEDLLKVAEANLRPYAGKRELSQIFQALRIEVNDELGALQDMLLAAQTVLKPQGRIAILTYHSLEDRMVKNFFRAGNIQGDIQKDFYGNIRTPFRLLTNKPIIASLQEVNSNPRSRSAKLRVAEKKDEEPVS